jgi:hypothetical protein
MDLYRLCNGLLFEVPQKSLFWGTTNLFGGISKGLLMASYWISKGYD